MESALKMIDMCYGDKNVAITRLEKLIEKYENAPQTVKVKNRTKQYNQELKYIKSL